MQANSQVGAEPCKMPAPKRYVRKHKTAEKSTVVPATDKYASMESCCQPFCDYSDATALRIDSAYDALLDSLMYPKVNDSIVLDECVIGVLNNGEK